MITNKKRFFLAVIILLVLVAVIIFIGVKFTKKTNETNGDFSLDGSQENIDSKNSQENNENVENNDNNAENDGTSIPQQETEGIKDYVDEKGNQMSDEDVQNVKNNIVAKFKSVPSELLGISADLNTARIMFNQGVTIIAQKECYVFNVYVQEGDSLNNIGMYAMSTDTTTLYKFNYEKITYGLSEM